MKNVTDSLKASDSTAVAPIQPNYFEKDEFEISYNEFYTNPWNRHNGQAHLEALQQLMIEGRKRGYTVYENTSMETMVRYIKFVKRPEFRGKSSPVPEPAALPNSSSAKKLTI